MKFDILDSLLDRCLQGETAAQHQLWEAVKDKLHGWISSQWTRLQDPDVRAIACEAFAEALISLVNFRRESTFETWLRGIARRVAFDYQRDLDIRKKDVPLDSVPEEKFFRPRRKERESASTLREDMRDLLRQVMLLVSHDQAVAVTLRYGAMLSPTEAAIRMGRSRRAFNMLVWRAMPVLKRVLLNRLRGVDPLREDEEGPECFV